MATYDINGFTYRSPKELTEEELLDLSKNLKESGALDPEARNQEISGREELKSNVGLLDAYRVYYRRMNGEDFKGTNDELVDEYMQQMRDWNLNTGALAALSGRLAGNSFSEKERQSIAIMWDTWDRVIPFYRQKDGKWQAIVDSAQSIATDPTNLLGLFTFGTANAAAVAAREAAKLGIRKAIKAYAVQGIKSGAITGAVDAGATNILEQNVKTNIGQQDEFSGAELAKATVVGAGAGGVLGGVLGVGQGALKGSRKVASEVPAERIEPTLDGAAPATAATMPPKAGEWMTTFKTTPLEKESVYHETSAESAAAIFQDDLKNTVEGARSSKLFVADNPEIAIGQSGSGVLIEFNGRLVSGKENVKPGTGDVAGREYVTDAFAQNSIKSITLKQGGELPMSKSWKGVLENDFNKEVLPDGSIKWTRKETPTTPMRNPGDAEQGLAAAQKFSDKYDDPLVKAEARAQARAEFLEGVSDSTRRYFERSGDLGKTVSFEEAQNRVGSLFDKIGVDNYGDLTSVADKLEKAFNSGKLDVTDLSTLTAGVIGTETHAFRKFQEAYLNNAEDLVRSFEAYEKIARLSSHLSNQQARSTAFQINRMRESLDPLTYAQAIELVAKSTNGLEAKTLQDLIADKVRRYGNVAVGALNEFWVHNILGSPRTLGLNVLGGVSVAVTEPGSRVLGGLLQGDSVMTRAALREWVTMASTIHQSAFYALKAFYTSKTYIDNRVMNEVAERGQDIFLGDKDLMVHQILMPWKYGWMNSVGNINRFVGKRGMQATDELMKQMAFRSRIMALATEEGIAKGMSYGDAVKYAKEASLKAINDQLDAAAQGKKVENPLAVKALEYARYTVFQNDLPDDAFGRVGQTLSTIRNQHPLFTQIFPFIRTPFNLMEYHSARLPIIQNFTATIRDKLNAGGKQAAEVEGAIHIGNLVLASSMLMAFTDQMEGGQSGTGFTTDVGKTGVLRGSGVMPYSIMIDKETGERVRIDRVDPWARHFTLMAKIKDIYKYGTKQDQDAVYAGLLASFASNYGEMSTLGSVKQILDAFQSEKSLGQTMGDRIATNVPYFRLLQDVWGKDYKVAHDIVDSIYKNVPGLNNDMDVRRHPVFGTTIERLDTFGFPMSPLPKSNQSQDMVDKELIRLSASIRPPEAKLFDGRIDLTKIKHPKTKRTAYDRYQELAGLVKNPKDNKNLYEKMREIIEDPRYWSTASDPQNQIDVAEEGGKVAILKHYVKAYRKLALDKLASEIPGLEDQINKAYQDNRAANSIPGQSLLEQRRAEEQMQ